MVRGSSTMSEVMCIGLAVRLGKSTHRRCVAWRFWYEERLEVVHGEN